MIWRRLPWPRGLAGQIATWVILALLLSQFLTAWLLIDQAPRRDAPPLFAVADQVALIIRTLDAVPAADRPAIMGLRRATLHVDVGTDGIAPGTEPAAVARFRRLLEERLANRFALRVAKWDELGLPRRVIVVAWLADGTPVRIEADVLASSSVFFFSFERFYLPALSLVLILTLWVTRRITAPLRAFSDAAERLGNERSAPSLPESGPIELRRAARSFNKMQEQVKRFIEDRTRTLAAISHDLRTPITRLRLRVEAVVENAEEQQKMLRDLERMDAMVSSAVSFLRNGTSNEAVVAVDLASLLQAVCDDFSDMGHDVHYVGIGNLPLRCRPELLTRAVTNLVENASKHANRTTVDLARDRIGTALIEVEDDGPGIPEDEMAKAFDPFYRLDAARDAESGGFGLGLAIAKTIVELHRGHIELTNRRPSGLRVVVTLPPSVTDASRAI